MLQFSVCEKFAMNNHVFPFQPWAKWLELSTSNEEKLPESAWKTMHYSFTWLYSAYLLFAPGKYDFFYKSEYMWIGKYSDSFV